MSLDWSVEKVRDWKEIVGDTVEGTITEALIWRCMVVGLPSITEKNADEFAERSRMYELCNGSNVVVPDPTQDEEAIERGEIKRKFVDYYITRADIERRIGLSTNVSRMSPTQFEKNMMRALRDRARIHLKADERKREEAA